MKREERLAGNVYMMETVLIFPDSIVSFVREIQRIIELIGLKRERMIQMNYATYQTTPSTNRKGTWYFADCGHEMYSDLGPECYHGRLCPGCLSKGIETTLYIRGSEEANRIMDERIKNGEDIPLIRWDLKFVKGES